MPKRTRFIPTYVGHTMPRESPSLQYAVHPHIRGAYKIEFSVFQVEVGSSPHTWGIRLILSMRGKGFRFIPTYVGHTIGLLLPSLNQAVHPHIRGAYAGTESPARS